MSLCSSLLRQWSRITGERLCEGAGACLEVTPLAPPQKPQPTVSEWLQLHERGVVDAAELRRPLGLEAHGAGEDRALSWQGDGMSLPPSPACSWRPGDTEALRIALSIPVTPLLWRRCSREMAQLEIHYPTGVCTAQGHLEAIAALDQQLAALTPAELNAPIRSRRKGVAGGVVPNPLPLSKLDVVEYATELLLEETDTEWNADRPSAAVVLSRQRSHHIGQLALLLPRLQSWRQSPSDPFLGSLVRG